MKENIRPANDAGLWRYAGRSSLFAGVAQEVMDTLFSKARTERYEKGETIIAFQDETTDVFFILEGRVSVTICTDDGKEVFFREVPEGECFGEFSAIDRQPRSASIVASSPAALVRVGGEHFLAVLRSSPEIALNVIRSLVRRNRELTERVFANVAQDVSARIRSEIYRLAMAGSRYGSGAMIEPAPSHYEIAIRVGTHREAVSRELSRLSRLGVLTCGRRRIEVRDIARLAVLANPGSG